MINVMGKTITREEAQELVEDIQEQLEQPDFWPGQLIEVWDDTRFKFVTFFSHISEKGTGVIVDTYGSGYNYGRPLNDPLIWQFKLHKPVDAMPCDGGLNVRALYPGERTICNRAEWADWNNAVGWMPAGGWK